VGLPGGLAVGPTRGRRWAYLGDYWVGLPGGLAVGPTRGRRWAYLGDYWVGLPGGLAGGPTRGASWWAYLGIRRRIRRQALLSGTRRRSYVMGGGEEVGRTRKI
jgi:hypothetical protein